MLRLLLVLLVVSGAVLALASATPDTAIAHPSDSLLDQDHDGIDDPPYGPDNCAGEDAAFNPTQVDSDFDGKGDACDVDDDGDSVDDALDNCPLVSNQGQSDIDGDNTGDACDFDDDGDGLADSRDNCPAATNAGQEDSDGDGVGDACQGVTPVPPAGDGTAPPPTDSTAPDLTLRVRSLHRTVELGAGLVVPAACSERCTLTSRLRLTKHHARRLGVDRLLGTGTAGLDAAGETFIFLQISGRTLRRMRRAGPVRAVLRVGVADPAGNRRALTRRLTIRR